jgi:hypothetical protein
MLTYNRSSERPGGDKEETAHNYDISNDDNESDGDDNDEDDDDDNDDIMSLDDLELYIASLGAGEEREEERCHNASDDGNNTDDNEKPSYYDDFEPEPDSDEENEALLLQVNNDAIDSGSESVDDHCYGFLDENQSDSVPSAWVEGTLTREKAKWFLL